MYVQRRRTRTEIWTPAKLNLYLEVLSRRPDGYHEIETLMVPVNLYDTLQAELRADDSVELTASWAPGYRTSTASRAALSQAVGVSGGPAGAARSASTDGMGDLPEGEQNLVVRAILALRRHAEAAGVDRAVWGRGLQVTLTKRIPSAAGLGGGSSDAAAALVAANELWALGWSREQLAAVAAELGSDIPFFLAGTAAICRGRGERIAALHNVSQPIHFVILRPPLGCSTAEVYRRTQLPACPERLAVAADVVPAGDEAGRLPADDRRTPRLGSTRGALHWLKRPLFNRLQAPAQSVAPELQVIEREFARLGLESHQLSGSGSCYFGVCRDGRHARQVAAILRSRCAGRVYSVRSCCRMGRA